MKNNSSSVMLKAMLLSGFFIGLTLFKVVPIALFVIALLPMIWYHLAYLAPKAKAGELTSVEVDSVYYYGFLVTVLALAVSALALTIHGIAASITLVGAQFGLGLIATGYAVAARMHLLAISRSFDAGNEGKLIDVYVTRSRELISNIELASSSFQTFATSLQERAAGAAEAAQRRSEEAIAEAARTFAGGISGSLEEAKASVTELRAVLSDATFTSERAELKKSVQASVAAVTKLNAALGEMASLSSTSATAAGELTGALSNISERAGLMTERLDVLTNENGTLAHFQERVHGAAEQIGLSAEKFDLASKQLASIGEGAVNTAGELIGLNDAIAETAKSLKPVGPAAERLGEIASSFQAVDTSLATIKQSGGALATDLERMGAALNAVLPLLDQFGQIGERSTPTLESMSQHVGQLEQLAAALAPVAQSMSNVSTVLSQHAEQLEATVSANEELARSISATVQSAPDLQATMAAIPTSLQKIEGAMSQTARSMTTMAETLEAAAKSAGSSLEETASTSAGYFKQVGESFTGLAGFIVEKTRERVDGNGKG